MLIDAKQIILAERARLAARLEVLDSEEHLDAQDEDARLALSSGLGALDRVLRAIEEAERVVLDQMAADYEAECAAIDARCAREMERIGCIRCTSCGVWFQPDEIVYCFNEERCCAACDAQRPERFG